MPTTSLAAADPWADFHPAVAGWFRAAFPAGPTQAQLRAWPLIRARRPTLVAAPTGSGKTLTAFLAVIDELVRASMAGALPDATTVLYVSPLKALSNDIRINLQAPLEGIARELARLGLPAHGIRAAVRTGDTSNPERLAMRRRAPHILVTTPESLYVLLGSDSGRAMLADVRSVIVDEIHAVAGGKRGSHLALSLERLDALCEQRTTRIGLSATQKPLAAVARFLVGRGGLDDCAIVDVGHVRARDLTIELPPAPLEAVMANEVWERVYDRMAELAAQHRTTLVFVNSRRMAERAARHLSERLGDALVTAHHGSLAKEYRLDAEQRLKRGELRVLVATASLELGIDIGDVELVCQVGSPRSIAAFLQRVGRSGHQVGGMPKGRLFPTSRDDLIECAALLDCVRRDELDALRIPRAPLDVLAQQIVAEVASREWSEDALFDLVRRAEPYAGLVRGDYDAVLRMLAEGYAGRNGVRAAYIHRDTVAGTLRGRRGGKLTAVTSGGTIPDNADYAVLLEPQGLLIGTVNEDFAVECIAGDIFQLGNISYRILRVEAGRVRVVDARGAAPTMPFWLGEAPGRSDELSAGVARLRARIERWLAGSGDGEDNAAEPAAGGTIPAPRITTAAALDSAGASEQRAEGGNFTTAEGMAPAAAPGLGGVIDALADSIPIDFDAARQIVEYLARARSALGALPTQDCLVMERFFDESGGMQLVLHSPFGSRVNRAWGLALRKRFCRTFNVELQAAATEDAIVLSLSTSHSFALDEVWRYLRSATAEHVLIQALLDAPLFNVRWRWNATTSLALPRYSGGRKVAPQLQRMKSEDLLAAVFPDQVACFENLAGERELPDHPLVAQTIDDCLHEAMDSEGWLALLRRIEQGQVRLVARDLPAPSPLAMEILNARPYAFLDDAPLEERRTQAVLSRRWSDPESSDDLGALDAGAIAGVREEAWPQARNADEMHEALTSLSCVTPSEAGAQEGWPEWLDALARGGRATRLRTGPGEEQLLWVAVERLACLQAAYPQAQCEPALIPPPSCRADWERGGALVEIVRARLSGCGPLALEDIARPLGLPPGAVAIALGKLEGEGYVMRGRFTPGAGGGSGEEWCERHLLARIHRYTIKRLRREIEPVERRDYMRFLFDWQHLAPEARLQGRDALPVVLAQLEGYEAAAGAWESELLPARLGDYSAAWLDELCRAGRLAWTRIGAPPHASGGPVRATPVVLLPRRQLGVWRTLPKLAEAPDASARAKRVLALMQRHGAMFFDEMLSDAHLLPEELENALGELVATGLVTADSFAGLRALLVPTAKRARAGRRRHGGGAMPTMDEAGRWALVSRAEAGGAEPEAEAEADANGERERKRDGNTDRARDGGAAVAAPSVLRLQTTPGKRQGLDPQTLEHVAQVLLRRYGVVCWRLLEREAGWLPPWRDLLPVFHRLEARGELRGGRFVAGLTGEQFAVPEAIPLLREVRRRPPSGSLVCISAADPLNLCGGVLPGDKIPALTGNRVLFRDGVPVAALVADKTHYLVEPDARDRDALRAALIRSH